MPCHGLSEVDPRYRKQVHDAIDSHYRSRGVPEYRLQEMRWKWLRTKGLRAPGGA